MGCSVTNLKPGAWAVTHLPLASDAACRKSAVSRLDTFRWMREARSAITSNLVGSRSRQYTSMAFTRSSAAHLPRAWLALAKMSQGR